MSAASIAVLGLGCPRAGTGKDPDGGARLEDGGSARAAARPQIRVPLPDGWTALVTADGNLRAGPPGRPLMRIDREAGAAPELPTPEALKAAFASGLKSLTIKSSDVSRADGFVGLKLTLARAGPEAGAGSASESFAAIAARRAGTDLFLCSTGTGAAVQDVTAALKSCAEIGTAAADAP